MGGRVQFLLALACLWLAPHAGANDLASVKCGGHEDSEWVYKSVDGFEFQARLKCGESVEILRRIKGYVFVRTKAGVEGFVPDEAFPDLPVMPELGYAAAANSATRQVAAAAPASAPSPAAEAKTVPPPVFANPAPETTAVRPSPTLIAPPGAAENSAPAKPVTPAPVPILADVSAADALAPSAPPLAKSVDARRGDTLAALNLEPAAPSLVPAKTDVQPSIETVSDSNKDNTLALPAGAPATEAAPDDPENYPLTQPQFDSADPACHVYFAAYGITPLQYKWLADNRRQEFPAICPAPDPEHVDYVFLFTHDTISFAPALPAPVHNDGKGFSDFTPLFPVDDALVPRSVADRPQYESVWVFRMTRGAFDPARFSPRRRPTYTTYVKGAHAPSRALEEAFHFAETHGVNR